MRATIWPLSFNYGTMIKAKLVIENHTRDYFCEEFTDEFELVAIENRTDDYELRHNECRVTTLNKEQLQELCDYIQAVIKH